MAELAVTDGMPPPDGLPRGDFSCTMVDGELRIDHADPRILISGKLLARIFIEPVRGVSLAPPPDDTPGLKGALLHIHGVNRTVIYRIAEYVPRVDAYIAEWPD